MVEEKDIKNLLKEVLGTVKKGFEKFEKRMTEVEIEIKAIKTGKDDRFKLEAKAKDIKVASEGRESLNPKLVKIIDEMLGEDFRIELEPRKEGVGFTFTLIVPRRLSLLPKTDRPISGKDGKYKKNKKGEVITEEYYPEDRRSKALSTMDSWDAIKKHCERVRANIVATYQKMNKPLPEFRLRKYG